MKARCNGASARPNSRPVAGLSGAPLSSRVLLLAMLVLLSACAQRVPAPQPIITAPAAPPPRLEVAACPPLTAQRPVTASPTLPASAGWRTRLRTALADLAAWADYAIQLEPSARCGAATALPN